jgi:hypothetical protein
VVRPKDGGTAVFSVNLKDQLQHGSREPFVVHAGDVVFVRGTAGWNAAWTVFTQVLATSRDLANIVVIADYVKNRRTNP